MTPEQVRTAADARAIVEARGLTHVKVGVFDSDGILRGKLMSRAKFFSSLESESESSESKLSSFSSVPRILEIMKLSGAPLPGPTSGPTSEF